MKEELYRVKTNNACFGLITKDNIVIHTAPIGKRFLGYNIRDVKLAINNREGEIKKIKTIKQQKRLL